MTVNPVSPDVVPPPGKPRWELAFLGRERWRFGVRVFVQRFGDLSFTSGAYWVRYWNWSVGVKLGPWRFMLWHFVERRPD